MDPYALLAFAVEEGIIPGRAGSTSVECAVCGADIIEIENGNSGSTWWVDNDGQGMGSPDNHYHEPF